MRKIFWLVLLVAFLISACKGGAQPTGVITNPEEPTLTAAPSATPRPQAVIAVDKAILYSGPDNLLFDSLGELLRGAVVEPLGIFGDFLQVETEVEGKKKTGYLHVSWVDSLPDKLPQLTQSDVPMQRENALEWDGWDFKDTGMLSSVNNGVLAGSSTSDWMTVFNEKHPIKLTQPLSIQVQAKSEGKIADITFAGRMSNYESKAWWDGIRRLNIMFHTSNDQELAITFYDGTQEHTVSKCRLKPIPENGKFMLTFRDVSGSSFTITDSSGNSLLIENASCSLPSPLFPDGVAYLGFNIEAGSKIQIAQYDVITPASGKFVNLASLKQASPVYTTDGNLLSGDIQILNPQDNIKLLGAAGELAWVEWVDKAGKTEQGIIELAKLDNVLVVPQTALVQLPWFSAGNGLFNNLWKGQQVLMSNKLVIDGGEKGANAVSYASVPWGDNSGIDITIIPSGQMVALAIVDATKLDNTLFTLMIEDKQKLGLYISGQNVFKGLLPEDGRLNLRVANHELFVKNSMGINLASVALPGETMVNEVRFKLIAGQDSRLTINDFTFQQAPPIVLEDFAQYQNASLSNNFPVINKQNAVYLTRMGQLDFGSPITAVISEKDQELLVATSRGIITFDINTYQQLASNDLSIDTTPSNAFSSDGLLFARGLQPGEVQIWNTKTGQLSESIQIPKCQKIYKDSPCHISLVEFFREDQFLLIRSEASIFIYDIANDQVVSTIIVGGSYSLDITNDGNFIANGSYGEINIYSIADGGNSLLRKIEHPYLNENRYPMDWLGFSSDNRILYAQFPAQGMLLSWNVETGKLINEWYIGTQRSYWLSSDDRLIFAIGQDWILRIFYTDDIQHPSDLGYVGPINQIIGTDMNHMVLMSDTGEMKLVALRESSIEIKHSWMLSAVEDHSGLYQPERLVMKSLTGDRILVATDPFSFSVWHVGKTFQPVSTITPGSERISIALSPDGEKVAYSHDHSVQIWDLETNTAQDVYNADKMYPRGLAYSPDGNLLAIGINQPILEDQVIDRAVEIVIFNTLTNNVEDILPTPDSGVYLLSFSPDGKWLAGLCMNGKILIWNAINWELHKELSFFPEGNGRLLITGKDSLKISPDGKKLAVMTGDNYNDWKILQIWDLENGQKLWEKYVKYSVMTFSPDSSFIAASGLIPEKNRELFIADTITGEMLKSIEFKLASNTIYGLEFSSDGKSLISVNDKGEMDLWSVDETQSISQLAQTFIGGNKIIFSPDGKLISTTPWMVYIYEIANGSLVRSHEGFTAFAFQPDGEHYVMASPSQVQTFSLETGKLVKTPIEIGTSCTNIISLDGNKLACQPFLISHLDVFDLTSNSKRSFYNPKITGAGWYFTKIFRLSQDGSLLAVVWENIGEDSVVYVYDSKSGSELSRLQMPMREINDLSFSPDNMLLATVGEQYAQVWSLTDQNLLMDFRWEPSMLGTVNISPDAKLLATGSMDGVVQLWSLKDGQLVDVIDGVPFGTSYLAFSPDSRSLAVSYKDDKTRLYDISGVK